MNELFPDPSVGKVVKKLLELNPDLNTSELIAIVRQSMRKLGGEKGEFSRVEVIDEDRAIDLAVRRLSD